MSQVDTLRDHYDYSEAQRNPYAKRLKKQVQRRATGRHGSGHGDQSFEDVPTDGQPLQPQGAPTTGEIAVNSVTLGREELIALEVDPLGSFRIHWESYSPDDELLGRWVRSFDAAGNALGVETAETPQ